MKCVFTSLLIALAVILVPDGRAQAHYARADIETVPVDRLLRNIGRLRASVDRVADPERYVLLTEQLARVHGIAYARGLDEMNAMRETGEFFEGYGWTPAIPAGGDDTGDRSHLDEARKLYEQALEIQPGNLRLKTGYAWCLEESGEKNRPIELYREIVSAGWQQDKDSGGIEFGSQTITEEAAFRLIGLLDARDDAQEIAGLKRRIEHLKALPRWITPILVPLASGTAFEDLVDRDASVAFDLDGSGFQRQWRWISRRSAWLVWDPERTGRITSGLQLFGSVTHWLFWRNGYDALAALDDNADGEVSGAELDGLALWRDDGDGVSEPGEVRPIREWRIRALRVRHETHALGFEYSPAGVVLEDGAVRPTFDWIVPQAPLLQF